MAIPHVGTHENGMIDHDQDTCTHEIVSTSNAYMIMAAAAAVATALRRRVHLWAREKQRGDIFVIDDCRPYFIQKGVSTIHAAIAISGQPHP
jgi:hypothetical protein